MDLGARLAAWRRSKGISQRDLAKSLGITHAAISQWEDGATQPTQENLAKVVDLFGLTMEKFYGRIPAAKAS
jgi:transcriptional regulator with XRE-family HTH domain